MDQKLKKDMGTRIKYIYNEIDNQKIKLFMRTGDWRQMLHYVSPLAIPKFPPTNTELVIPAPPETVKPPVAVDVDAVVFSKLADAAVILLLTPRPPEITTAPVDKEVESAVPKHVILPSALHFATIMFISPEIEIAEIAPDGEGVLSVELDTVNVSTTFTATDIPTPTATVAAPVIVDALAVVFASNRMPVIDEDVNDVEPDTDNLPPMKVAPVIPTPPLKVAEPVVVDEDAVVFVTDNVPLLLIPPPAYRTEEIPTSPKNVAHPVVIKLDTFVLVTERIPVVEIEFKTDNRS
ncbi:hypothetical protein BDK51DRAFT_33952 [Blyttiomyces helicus]|uniref:Uncharacterized protein n=1 Tax=Blyttiomyces helicus TaxID=388810 RepID=A0A4P9W5T3_9FUNG|nr:hypothetical protein BDK51DRAFT_33952 [Blyttiomyces helicus]|eukprot:RKO87322.1 hypothetical protein BDK51DRAFT_33952 [Blyttiomyces helicus]